MITPNEDIPISAENKVSKKTKSKKTRNRTPLSCSVCRSRKVKCDKNKPYCNSCINTGYKHLCQYLSPEWSKDGYNHIFQENEIKEMKDKIKYLEEMLANYQNNGPSNTFYVKKESTVNSPLDFDFKHEHNKKYANDEINVSKRFESLHINSKTNSFTYLGSTHYLSILKGDPYLKLLWEHVFKIREKVLEYQIYQRNVSIKKQMKKASNYHTQADQTSKSQEPAFKKCPVNHEDMSHVLKPFMGPHSGVNESTNVSKGRCPVAHNNINTTDTADIVREGRRPINHETTRPRSLSPMSKEKSSEGTTYSGQDFLKEVMMTLPEPGVIKDSLDLFFKETYPEIPILEKKIFYSEITNILGIEDFLNSTKADYKLTLDNMFKSSQFGILLIILRLGFLNSSQDMNIDLKLDLEEDFVKEHLEFHLPTDNNYNSFPDSAISNKPINYHKKKSNFNIEPKYIHAIYERHIKNRNTENDTVDGYYGNGIVFTNLSVIQFLIFYKWYLGICPENDTVDTLTNVNSNDKKSELLLAEIVQLSFDSGLHRDPDNFTNITSNILNRTREHMNTDDKDIKIIAKTINQSIQIFKNQWRKTWFYLVSMDVNQCLNNGTPRLLRKLGSFSDVKLPYNITLRDESETSTTDSDNKSKSVADPADTNVLEPETKTNTDTIEYLLMNEQVDYCFGNNLGEIIIGKNTKLFYQIDLVLIAISELVLNSQPGFKAKKWQLDFMVDILERILNNKNNEDVIKKCISLLLDNNLLDPLEAYAIKEKGFENITPAMCKTDSQRQRFSQDTGYNLPSLKEIFSVVDNKRQQDYNLENVDAVNHGKVLSIPQENTTKCLFFKKHLQIQMMLYNLNYILFTSYEPRIQSKNADEDLMDLAVYYCQQSLKYSTEIFKTSLIFFHNLNANKIFKTQMKIVLIPYCLDVCYRSMQFMICLILRQKVGTLLKDLNNVFSKKISGSQNNTSSDSESDNDSFSKTLKKKRKSEFNKMIFENETLSLQEPFIAELLMSRMDIFHNLTRILAVKYKYSLKLSRSTGFFLTLLRPNSSKNKNMAKNIIGTHSFGNKLSVCPVSHNGSFTSLTQCFKNIPTLIMQANSDQLSRCPVYQDIDFQNKLPSLTSLSKPINGSIGSIRPPSISTFNYQPITSKINGNISNVRTMEETNGNSRESLGSRSNSILNLKEPPTIVKKNLLESNILPFPDGKTTPRPSLPLQNTDHESTTNSSVDYMPDFEEFLNKVGLSPLESLGNGGNWMLPLFDTSPDSMETLDMNSLISPNNIMQASMIYLAPSDTLTEINNDDVLVKRENSNQSVWDINEDLIN
ncbi:unnamed protein product [Hanseniaspora opuntiae]